MKGVLESINVQLAEFLPVESWEGFRGGLKELSEVVDIGDSKKESSENEQ